MPNNLLLLFLRLTKRNWKVFSLLFLIDSLHFKHIHAHPLPNMLLIKKLCADISPSFLISIQKSNGIFKRKINERRKREERKKQKEERRKKGRI